MNMPREVKPVSAKLSTLVHATEDSRKVFRALDQVCPTLNFEQKSETRRFKGHYGNEITTLTVSVRKRSAGPFIHYLLKLFSNGERTALLHDLDSRMDDDGHLYVRLDKQQCLQGSVRLADQDPIKCEFSFEIEHGDGGAPSNQIKRFLGATLDRLSSPQE